MALLPLYQTPTQNNLQYTLNAQIAAGDTSLTLNTSVTGIVQAPGVLVVDRISSSGSATPTVREYISFTGVSGSSITGLTRGLAGSTAQAHQVGAVVEFVPDVVQQMQYYSVFTLEHTPLGQHGSLPSTSMINTLAAAVLSTASVQLTNTNLLQVASGASLQLQQLAVTSLASLQQIYAMNLINASGASVQGVDGVTPVWVFSGTLSGASTQLGKPLDMPLAGTIQFISAISRTGSSNASLFLDITKNGSSIISSNGSTSLLYIPINGTFVSLASISTPKFVAGDVFNFSTLFPGSMAQDLTVKFFAR